MKKAISKFFGISKECFSQDYYDYSVYSRDKVKCGWIVLQELWSYIQSDLHMIFAALAVLKLIGVYSGSWCVVIIPELVICAVKLMFDKINNAIVHKKIRIRDEIWKERESTMQKEILKYDEEYNDEEYNDEN